MEMDLEIFDLLTDAVSSGRFLGLTFIAVNKTGEHLYSDAHGYQNFSRDQAMTTQTNGWLASLSKLMTAVAVMIVVERGLVGLDDDVAKLLLELHDKEILTSYDANDHTGHYVPVTETITLRRLLSHTAGFSYGPMNPVLFEWAKVNNQTMASFQGDFKKDWDSPLVFQPGTDWTYGTSIDWAGKVVEQVSKKSLEDFMQENIWTPLGMMSTTFHPEKHATYPLLEMGTRSALGAPLEPCDLIYPIPAHNESGGAGIFSSPEDYSKLLGALLRDECPILKRQTLEELFSPQLSPQCKKGLTEKRAAGFPLPEISTNISASFSLAGLYLEDPIPGGRARGSVAWDGMCSHQWLLDRSTGIAMVLFVQIMLQDQDTKALFVDLEQIIYKRLRS